MHGSSPCRRNTVEYHRRGRRIEGIEVDRRPRHIPHERTIEEHRRNAQPVTAQHLTDRSGTTRRSREDRDTPTAELLDGCKRGRVDDAIDTPQGAVQIRHHQFDRPTHHGDQTTNAAPSDRTGNTTSVPE